VKNPVVLYLSVAVPLSPKPEPESRFRSALKLCATVLLCHCAAP